MKKFNSIINYALLPLIIIILWETVTRLKIFPAVILPPLETVFKSFVEQLKSGQLPADIAISMQRVLEGYLISAVSGITLDGDFRKST